MRCSLITLALLCAGSVANAADVSFVGTWTTTFGQMVLADKGDKLGGTYGSNGISGTEQDGKFTFTYSEPGVTGEGVFEIAADGQSFTGKWRPNGSAGWSNWTGKRVKVPGEEPYQRKPVVFRYGHLPQGLPAYFTDADYDKDGQVGLYEWVKYWDTTSEAKIAEFKELDLNGDGLLTAEEYLRWRKAAALASAGKDGQPVVVAKPPSPVKAVEVPKK